MNILYINTRFRGGGAEKIAMQLYEGMAHFKDVSVFYLAGRASNDTDTVPVVYGNHKIIRLYNLAFSFLTNNARRKDYRFRYKVISIIKKYKIDIVHLHNIHVNYMGIQDIEEIGRYCKVVWTLHDMWALTGHCAYALTCSKWKEGSCGQCPDLYMYPKMWVDQAKRVYKIKKIAFSGKNIIYVTPSLWLMKKCEESFLRNEFKTLIYNGVDTDIFKPLDKVSVRKKYDIPFNKIVLMFAANNLENLYKGIKVLIRALEQVKKKEEYELVIVGSGGKFPLEESYVCHYMGYIHDDRKMNELYNLADIFILPSIAENFPCTVLESMASGTPVAASDVGGISEQVDEETGWLFEVGNEERLAEVIDNLPREKNRLSAMGVNCRRKVEQSFSQEQMIKKYYEVYQEIMEQKKNYKGDI